MMPKEIDKTNKKLAELERLSLKRNQSKELKLPDWPDSKRGTPNSFLRSALFTIADCKNDRIQLKDEILASQSGISLIYSGSQLNQEDLTIWETIVHLAKEQPLDFVCKFTAYEILKTSKQSIGGDGYERLDKSIMRLVEATVTIRQNEKKFSGHLINFVAIDEDTHHYKIELGRSLIKLYSESTWIDADQRLQLRRKSLAQFLHGYYSSHITPFPIKVATLHQLSGSNIKELRKFKQTLKFALEELVKINFLNSYHINCDLVTIKKK